MPLIKGGRLRAIVPAGTPREVVVRLHPEIVKAARGEDVRRSISAQGGVVAAGSPEQFSAHVRPELAKWGRVFKDADIVPE